jgi:hypothetical protein
MTLAAMLDVSTELDALDDVSTDEDDESLDAEAPLTISDNQSLCNVDGFTKRLRLDGAGLSHAELLLQRFNARASQSHEALC